jgi:hypothetical protein
LRSPDSYRKFKHLVLSVVPSLGFHPWPPQSPYHSVYPSSKYCGSLAPPLMSMEYWFYLWGF